jgi:hypothetical protein
VVPGSIHVVAYDIYIKKIRKGNYYDDQPYEYLTFKNRASYVWDGRTTTLQMLHFIYIFSTKINTEYFKHDAHSPFFSLKCLLFYNANFFGCCIFQIIHTGCAKI